ncbi:MAG: hypothetical protein ABL908_08670 [Hyphomicrobium sp.]
MPAAATGSTQVKHLRQILLWPVYLLPLDEDAPVENHWEHLQNPSPDNPWREVDDEFGDPSEFQARHYSEFVTFLPPVQRFLYGQGLGRVVGRTYGESPITVMRRTDIKTVRVTLEQGTTPVLLDVVHIDLYFFFDIDVALLAFEVTAEDLPFDVVQEVLFRFGRAYPAYWEADGQGGHCPYKVEWLAADGTVMAVSDYEKKDKFLGFVCQHRAPAVAAHWEYLLSPLVLHHSDRHGPLRYRQLEYYRMPYMVFLAMQDASALSRPDLIRLAIGSAPGDSGELPYSDRYLADFETKHCYDRYCDLKPGARFGTRFMTTGHTLIVLGEAGDGFFNGADGGVLSRFRHQHFLLFLIAHFQKASLRMFSDRLVAIVSRLDITDADANRVFRRSIRNTLENFLRFEHRYWFHEISNHAQARELFSLTRGQLDLDPLYDEVREELQDMGNFLEVEAMRRQNDTVVRLTVVTILGLIGTITTGFLGMNLLSWSDQATWWRTVAFLSVFVPTIVLTIMTVSKSKRLSEWLDALADDTLTTGQKFRAFWRVWFPGK